MIFAVLLLAAAPPELTLERIYSEPPLEGRAPRDLQFSPTSEWVSFLRPSVANREVLELWGAHLPDGRDPRVH